MARFTGKVAIVTGASTGLGPVMAKMLADEGAKVVMAARRFELVEKAAAEIGEAAFAIRADVTKEADVAAMVDAAMDRWGQVDILMNNAAIPGKDTYVWEQDLENWNATFAVDVTAAMLCSRECRPPRLESAPLFEEPRYGEAHFTPQPGRGMDRARSPRTADRR